MIRRVINVYSLNQIEKLQPSDSAVVISIVGPDWKDKDTRIKAGWHAILSLKFDDVNANLWDTERFLRLEDEYTLFDSDHARLILLFADKHSDKDIVVHCMAGHSRSVAVGMFLGEILDRELKLHAIHNTASYNSFVYTTLKREYSSKVHGVPYMPPKEWQ
jgi:predicted protein tyrosine phosphatase